VRSEAGIEFWNCAKGEDRGEHGGFPNFVISCITGFPFSPSFSDVSSGDISGVGKFTWSTLPAISALICLWVWACVLSMGPSSRLCCNSVLPPAKKKNAFKG